MINPLGYLNIAQLVVLVVLWGLWQGERAESAGLKAQNDLQEASIEAQKTTIQGLTNLANKQAENIAQYGERTNEILREEGELRSEIVRLRSTAPNEAFVRPFEHGNASHNRISAALLRFSEKTGGDRNENNPDYK